MRTNSKKRKSFFLFQKVLGWFRLKWRAIFGPQTPHKSFALTRRRDAVQPLILPGYVSFTNEVLRTIFKHRKVLLGLAAVHALLYAVLVGIGSQETYATLSELLRESTAEVAEGVSGALWQTGLLFMSIASSGLSEALTPTQQLFAGLLFVMMWLSTVWLLRNVLAGKRVKMRDGLYNSGTPLFATITVLLLILVQLLPLGVAFIGYTAASTTGLLEGGVEAMLFWIAAGFLGILSIYWVLSSFFALIIITIPGTYPLWALHTSSKMVSGRRIPLLLRLVWQGLVTAIMWAAVLIPMILIDTGLKQAIPALDWLPLVPVVLLLLSSWTVLWACTYVYLLYRKVVDNES